MFAQCIFVSVRKFVFENKVLQDLLQLKIRQTITYKYKHYTFCFRNTKLTLKHLKCLMCSYFICVKLQHFISQDFCYLQNSILDQTAVQNISNSSPSSFSHLCNFEIIT